MTLDVLGYRLPGPTRILCDNTAVLALVRRRFVNSRLRHYRVNLAFVFDAVERGLTSIVFCRTHLMRANFLTKAESPAEFLKSVTFIYGQA